MRTLKSTHPSLAHGVPSATAGTIYVLTVAGGVTMPPKDGRELMFGRNREDVHVCIGEDDTRVSRHQGTLTYRSGSWWIKNTGRLPLRLPGSQMVYAGDEPDPLSNGYTAAFVGGTGGREHLLEIFIVGTDQQVPVPRATEATEPPRTWRLAPAERIVLVALAQRYLRQEAHPQPLTWRLVAEQLRELDPDADWTPKRVEHLVTAVRVRLANFGVSGLTREEVGEPVGNALNTHLIAELLQSTTLVPPDLALLD